MFSSAFNWERIALKWRALAEERRDHFLELYTSGRWTHYYTDEEFLAEMSKAVALADRWSRIAPLHEAQEPPAEPVQAEAA